jgi:DNA-binding XRE family transcriptional regulator
MPSKPVVTTPAYRLLFRIAHLFGRPIEDIFDPEEDGHQAEAAEA